MWKPSASVQPQRLNRANNSTRNTPVATRDYRPLALGSKNTQRCIHITRLHPKTTEQTIQVVFSQFGHIEKIKLGKGTPVLGAEALLTYSQPPESNALLRTQITVDGFPVNIAFRDLDEYVQNTPPEEEHQRCKIPVSCFSMGFLRSPKTFMTEWSTIDNPDFVIDYDHNQCEIHFFSVGNQYKLEFGFKDLANDFNFEYTNNSAFFTIPLKTPPKFWKKSGDFSVKDTNEESGWVRVVEIPMSAPRPGPPIRTPITPMVPDGYMKLNTWVVYRVEINPPPDYYRDFQDILQTAVSYRLIQLEYISTFHVFDASDFPIPLNHNDRAKRLPFDMLYLLESSLLSRQMDEHSLDKEFYDTLTNLDPAVASGILTLLVQERKRVWNPATAFQDMWKNEDIRIFHQQKIPSHCGMVRKVLVAPTGLYLEPPIVETTNRVIRHFSEHADRFLRVNFVDEDFGPVGTLSSGINNEALYSRIFKTLINGIKIGPRRFDFLAYSKSQLLEHGCWFFAPTQNLTTTMIRDWMGDFSDEKVIASYGNMMGQCLSSTYPITPMEGKEVDYIDDLIRGNNLFSDGVGKVSPKLAREISSKLDLKRIPSAFEFRLGGAKGVLCLSNYLNGRKINLRPSQIKFESRSNMLEITRASKFLPAYLNQQTITLLSSLRIDDSVFMTMFDKMVNQLSRMLETPLEAINALTTSIDDHSTVLSMARMVESGFLLTKDPYLVNMIHLFRASILKNLKKNAKIIVPEGGFLMGVLDETNTLGENEVFIQISNPLSGTARRIIKGETLIYRDPCFNVNQMRVVTAVDSPQLHHIYNVIVFSSKGYRSIPSICSGGSLGGDNYMAIWDLKLMPKGNYPPIKLAGKAPIEVEKINVLHVEKFFVSFVSNDNLDQIIEAHTAIADQSKLGALDGHCSRLAELHSQAAEFANTGRSAEFPLDLRVKKFPDFMQKKDKESYASTKILGNIFRAIDPSYYKQYRSFLTDNATYDNRLWMPGMEPYIAEARELKIVYTNDVMALMSQYGVQTESELMSGFVIKWLKKGDVKSKARLGKQVMAAVKSMCKLWKRRFELEFTENAADFETRQIKENAMNTKAAAWYYVTYHPQERSQPSPHGVFFSFPWVVKDKLCSIATSYQEGAGQGEIKPLDESLVKNYKKNSTINVSLEMFYSASESEEEDGSDEESEDEGWGQDVPTVNIRISDLRI
ncbi:RNA-dependent RNA polymerase RdRP [Phycomyces blakesleeanus]|uniref:RNA-dependent RNA polymerase n=2 Tax=Phycomyces blakesleeanus TaxID=4837 RepID=A0A163CZ85_PHYB8|nr:RNA-dependent RNA polymerase RdRP [Phycomyces blakesleeanus NRRL 1555(-)]OAD67590.1 RNA-dependent RNA polymerase RdRP [Phycomyces blakesleeanus NRRL 1555(-)]|eukprot:XP_018285630.1 RNA-dependent RNA polymerase RdRP [Phycomyces blakesleeanus NRRL 1555(-)]